MNSTMSKLHLGMGCWESGRTSGGLGLEGPYCKIDCQAKGLACPLKVIYGEFAERNPLPRADFLVYSVRGEISTILKFHSRAQTAEQFSRTL